MNVSSVILTICTFCSTLFVGLTLFFQQRVQRKKSATKVSTWYEPVDNSSVARCIIQNKNDFPIYNVIAIIISNHTRENSSIKLLELAQQNQDILKGNRETLGNDDTDTEQSDNEVEMNLDSVVPMTEQKEIMASLSAIKYYEVLPSGKTVFKFDNNYSSGNEHKVPRVFFTDNQGVEWYRSPNGKLSSKKYIKNAQQLGIMLKHVQ